MSDDLRCLHGLDQFPRGSVVDENLGTLLIVPANRQQSAPGTEPPGDATTDRRLRQAPAVDGAPESVHAVRGAERSQGLPVAGPGQVAYATVMPFEAERLGSRGRR